MGRLSIIIAVEKSDRKTLKDRREELHDVQVKVRRMARLAAKNPMSEVPVKDAYTRERTAKKELDYLEEWEASLSAKLLEMGDDGI